MTVLNVAFRSMRPTHWRCSGKIARQVLFLLSLSHSLVFDWRLSSFQPSSTLSSLSLSSLWLRVFLFILKEILLQSFKNDIFQRFESHKFNSIHLHRIDPAVLILLFYHICVLILLLLLVSYLPRPSFFCVSILTTFNCSSFVPAFFFLPTHSSLCCILTSFIPT